MLLKTKGRIMQCRCWVGDCEFSLISQDLTSARYGGSSGLKARQLLSWLEGLVSHPVFYNPYFATYLKLNI